MKRWMFSICLIQNRFVLLSGGYKGYSTYDSARAEVWMFDIKTGKWLTSPRIPNLQVARYSHSSCATESAAFVYGGTAASRIGECSDEKINTIECLPLAVSIGTDSFLVATEWKSLNIDKIAGRINSLMVAV